MVNNARRVAISRRRQFRHGGRFAAAAIIACALAVGLIACGAGTVDEVAAGTSVITVAPAAPDRTQPSGGVRPVKWYPGHYLYFNWDAPDGEIARILAGNPRLRGIMFQFTWRELEPARDVYDFERISQLLARAGRLGTRLAIYLDVQAYLQDHNRIPDYIDGEEFGGGRYWLANGAVNPVIWNAAVAERIARLYRELGDAFDRDPRLAVVTTTETSLPTAGDPAPEYVESYTLASHAAAFERMIRALRDAFPTTVAIQNINFPEQILGRLTTAMRSQAIGMGGPDVFLDDPALDASAYRFYPSLAGVVPIGPSVQWDDYVVQRFAGPQSDHSVLDLYRFARDRLRANFLFWETRLAPRDFVGEIAAMMNAREFPADPAGGLVTACPIRFTACASEETPP